MIQGCTILFLLAFVKLNSANSIDYLCNYTVEKSDHNLDACLSNQCNKFLDPYSIMVKQNDCKTKSLYLAFSSFKKFDSFINRMTWKLGDLFPSRSQNELRTLRIYINRIDDEDQPVHHNELIRLGAHIDLYELYISYIPENDYLHELSHYDPNDPQWYIIKVKL